MIFIDTACPLVLADSVVRNAHAMMAEHCTFENGVSTYVFASGTKSGHKRPETTLQTAFMSALTFGALNTCSKFRTNHSSARGADAFKRVHFALW